MPSMTDACRRSLSSRRRSFSLDMSDEKNDTVFLPRCLLSSSALSACLTRSSPVVPSSPTMAMPPDTVQK